MVIGILALQGCIQPHIDMFARLDVEAVPVIKSQDLLNIERIVLPGGESTAMLRLLERGKMLEPLRDFCKTHATWGVCAGAILLAKKVLNPEQSSLGLIDITAHRNFYGSQLDSFSAEVKLELNGKAYQMKAAFIRAPFLLAGKEVKVLGSISSENDEAPVCFQQGKIIASTFHPELGEDTTLHQYFLEL